MEAKRDFVLSCRLPLSSQGRVYGMRPLLLVGSPLLVGIGLVTFAIVLTFGRCESCASIVPAWLVAGAGAVWLYASWCSALEKRTLATALALLLLGSHIGVIVFASQEACIPCFSFLAIESLVTLVLVNSSWPGSSALRRVLLTHIPAATSGFVGAAILFGVIWGPTPDRLFLGDANSKLAVYVVVRRNCSNCEALERRMREVLIDSLGVRSVNLVDERSAIGGALVREHKFSTFPSFVLKRDGESPIVQEGGAVTQFIVSVGQSRAQARNSK